MGYMMFRLAKNKIRRSDDQTIRRKEEKRKERKKGSERMGVLPRISSAETGK
jgi:hypothetical protein